MFRNVKKLAHFAALIALVVGSSQIVSSVAAPHTSEASASPATGTSGQFVPVQGRILDTRSATSVGGYTTPMTAQQWRSVQVAGRDLGGGDSIPSSGVSAVAVSFTVVGQQTAGLVRADKDEPTPTTSITYMNYLASGNQSNTGVVAVADNGKIQVATNSATDLLIDMQGYYTSDDSGTAPGGYVPVTPKRLVDTRNGTGLAKAKLAGGSSTAINVKNLYGSGVPAGATAAMVNFTITNYAGPGNGYFFAYPSDDTRPNSTFNFAPNVTDTTMAQIGLSTTGSTAGAFTFQLPGSGYTIDLLVEVVGYFTPGQSSGAFTPAQARVWDSRTTGRTKIAAGATAKIQVAGVNGIPQAGSGIAAVTTNLAAVNAGSNTGILQMFANGTPKPGTSSLIYQPGVASSNMATSALGANGAIDIYNSGPDSVDFVIDVEGWYSSAGRPATERQDRTQKSVTLQADPTGGGPWVTYQYRADLTGPYADIPLTDVQDRDGASPASWPTPKVAGVFSSYVWDIGSTLASLPSNNGTAPASTIQFQACYGATDGDTTPTCGMPNTVTFEPNVTTFGAVQLESMCADPLHVQCDDGTAVSTLSPKLTATAPNSTNNTVNYYFEVWSGDSEAVENRIARTSVLGVAPGVAANFVPTTLGNLETYYYRAQATSNGSAAGWSPWFRFSTRARESHALTPAAVVIDTGRGLGATTLPPSTTSTSIRIDGIDGLPTTAETELGAVQANVTVAALGAPANGGTINIRPSNGRKFSASVNVTATNHEEHVAFDLGQDGGVVITNSSNVSVDVKVSVDTWLDTFDQYDDGDLDALASHDGTNFTRQQTLMELKAWISENLDQESSSYVENINDPQAGTVQILWNGPQDSDSLVALRAKANDLRIPMTVKSVQYSATQLRKGAEVLLASKNDARWGSFVLDTVAGTDADHDGLTVRGYSSSSDANTTAANAVETAKAIIDENRDTIGLQATQNGNGGNQPTSTSEPRTSNAATTDTLNVQAEVEEAPTGNATAYRSRDFSPFIAGGWMVGTGPAYVDCSNGFAIWYKGDRHTTTARHCNSPDYYDMRIKAHYGKTVWVENQTATRVLGGQGYPQVFRGSWGDPKGPTYNVKNFADVSIGDHVCTSGAMSGMHCNIKVINLSTYKDDGYGMVQSIQGRNENVRGVSVATGDSGGPVFVYRGGGKVGAAGVIQFFGRKRQVRCGALRRSGQICSRDVYFTSMRVTVRRISGARLVTETDY